MPSSPPLQLLESCFLVSAALVLMAGMVFSADGFTPGSTGYNLLTALVSATIVIATATFTVLLAFEVYRSVKYAEAHALARQVEKEAVEEALLGRRHRRGKAGGGTRRRSSIVEALRRGGRRLSGGLGRATMAPSPTRDGTVSSSERATTAVTAPRDEDLTPQRRVSRLSMTVARQRRQSLLGWILGVAGAGRSEGGSGISCGPPSDQFDEGCSGSEGASVAPRAEPALTPSIGPPTQPPRLLHASPGFEVRSRLYDNMGGLDAPSHAPTGVVAATATRSRRVRTMGTKEPSTVCVAKMVHADPAPEG
jgi:hypothetical protein